MNKKKLILIVSIIIVGILLLCGILLSPNNQLAETATKNNASDNKMVTVYVLTSKVTSDGERHSYTYDKKGNLLTGRMETANYDCTYNQQGNIIGNSLHDGDYVYNSDGSISSVKCTKPLIIYRYSYDSRGNLVSVDYEDENNVTRNRATYVYDSQNRLVKESCGSSAVEQDFYRISEFTYSDKNQLKAITKFNSSTPEEKEKILLEYDDAGKLISRKVYFAEKIVCSTICEYDAKGRLVKVAKNGDVSNPVVNSLYTLHYENGLLSKIELCRYSEEVDRTKVDYTIFFDVHGNPIRKELASGDYVEYEYKAIQLSAQDAERYKRVQFVRKGISYDGDLWSESLWGWYGFYGPTTEFRTLIPYPTTIMYDIDSWEYFLRKC